MTQEPIPGRRNPYVWLTLILLLGFALRVYGLGDIAVNNDESIEYHRFIAESFRTLLVDELVLNSQTFAQLLSRTALLTLGDRLFALRWPALMISMLGIASIYRLARGLFGQRAGLFSALLLALSPFAIFFAHSFRGYSGVINLSIFVYLLGFLVLKTGRRRYWIGLSLAAVAMLYTHLFTLLAYLNLVVLLGLMGLAGRRVQGGVRPALPKLAASLALTAAILVVLFAPAWLKLLNPPLDAGDPASDVLWTQRPSVSASIGYNLWLYNGYWEEGSRTGHGVFILLALAAFGVWLGFMNQARWRTLALLGWAFLPFAQVWLLKTMLTGFWARPTYLAYTLAPLLILAGLGLAGLFRRAAQKNFTRPVNLALAPLLLLAVLWAFSLREFYQVYGGADWEAIGNLIQRNARPTDLVICHQYRHAWQDVDMSPENNCTRTLSYRRAADTPLDPLIADSHTLIFDQLAGMAASGMASRVGRVWLVVWDIPETVDLAPVEGKQAEFYQFGRSLVLLADRPQTYVENFYRALASLRATVPAGAQRFIYDLMVAPLAVASYQRGVAAGALADAERDRPDDPHSRKKLAQAKALVAALAPDSPEHQVNASFGQAVVLQGYTLSSEKLGPGATVDLTLFWQVTGPVPGNYSIFLHVRDQAGNIIAQTDYQPFNGAYPTGRWQVGQRLADQRTFQLPPEMPPAEYSLVVGLYNPADLTRLPVVDDQSGEDAVFLTTLSVTGEP